MTDHQTKREKLSLFIKKINPENLNKGINKMTKGIDDFGKVLHNMDFGMSKGDYDALLGDTKGHSKKYAGLTGKRDYSFLTGKTLRNSKASKRSMGCKKKKAKQSYSVTGIYSDKPLKIRSGKKSRFY